MSEHAHDHVVPVSLYFRIFGALMVLTALTVGIAMFDLGALNTPVALLIAVSKATLVLLFFMHLKYSPRLLTIVACAGFVWLAVMLILTMSDISTRDWIPAPLPF